MLITLPASSRDPLYVQVADAVRRQIVDGTIPGDQVLPAARDLAAALGVNMHTVLRAYAILRDEGLVDLRRRRGAVVKADAAASAQQGQLADIARALVEAARRAGLDRNDVIQLLDTAAGRW